MRQPLVTLRNTRPGFLVEGLPLSPEHPCHPGMKSGILFKAIRSITPGKGGGKSVKKKTGAAHAKVVHVKAGGMTNSKK
jgi:hypothetical protein